MPENMSKQTKRKITVEPPLNKNKDSQRRPSVFERLGTKATSATATTQASADNFCRHWVQNGNCTFGKLCKYANTHTLVSPSKQRAAKKDGDPKQKLGHNGSAKLHSTVVVKKSHSPDLNWENWDQTDLEYADEKVLEKRRQLLQRELELQMKREKDELRTKKDKKSKKGISSSSSTSGSSSSSSESSSSSDDSSSTSSSTSGDSRRRKTKSKKVKRDSSSSTSETDRTPKKKVNRNSKTKGESLPSPSKKNVPARRSDEQRPKRRDPSSPPRKQGISKGPQPPPRKRSATPPGRNSSSHRRRSQTPPVHGTKGKASNIASRSSQPSKPSGKHQSPRPSRGISGDRKDKQHSNRSVSPRIRDRDRDNKDNKEKERARSRSPKPKGKDRLSHSPRRNSRPPKDPRKKGSPDSGNSREKNFRLSPAKLRGLGVAASTRGRDASLDTKRSASKNSPNVSRDSDRRDNGTKEARDSSKLRAPSVASSRKEPDRKRDDREAKRSEVLSRERLAKDQTSRETTLERGNRNNSKDDLRRDDRKRDSQMLPGILEKTAQDRDFPSKSGGRETNDSDRDRNRPAGREAKEGRPNREAREAAREKEREEALERCRERQREREREKKAREFERELPSLLSLATHNPTPVIPPPSITSKGPSKAPERVRERGERGERGADRASVRPSAYDRERPFERTQERGLNFDRAPEREDYPPSRPREPEVRRPPPPEDKGYDSPFEGRRGRYSEQLDRSRYEDAPAHEDSRTMAERRLPPVDPRGFPEDRRGRRDGRSSLEPIRGREWEGSRGDTRELHDREQRELREQRRGYDREEPPHPLGATIKGRDWDTRDYSDTRREWDGRGRRGPPPEWEAAHRGEWTDKELPPHPVPHVHQPHEGDWNRFPGPVGEWVPPERRGGWVEEWGGLGAPPGRPPPRPQPPHREDPLHHMPVPEEPPPHEAGMKKLHEDLKDTIKEVKDEKPEGVKVEEPGVGVEPAPLVVGVKRPHSSPDGEPEAKKLCLDDSAPLEEVLSDISDDDADEILNREDSDTYGAPQDSTLLTTGLPVVPSVKDEGDEDKILGVLVPKRETPDARSGLVRLVDQQDDETIDNLGDFEEISDEELEEESKAGIGDALGVDWASLVAQSKPREKLDSVPGSARRRWDTRRVLQRLGVSHKFAGAECMTELTKLPQTVKVKVEPIEGVEVKLEEEENVEPLVFLHPVAAIHVVMQARVARRKALFSSFGPYKRALSARRDLAIRRQLCNLPEREVTVDTPQPDIEQFRLSVQLFERSVSKG